MDLDALGQRNFLSVVNGRFRTGTVAKTSKQDFLDEVRKIVFNFKDDPIGETQFIVDVETVLRKTSFLQKLSEEDDETFTNQQRRDLFKHILKNIKDKGKGPSEMREYLSTEMSSTLASMQSVWLLKDFLEELCSKTEECRRNFAKIKPYVTLGPKRDRVNSEHQSDQHGAPQKRSKLTDSTTCSGKEGKTDKHSKEKSYSKEKTSYSPTKSTKPSTRGDLPFCDTCGVPHFNARTATEAGQCRLASHEDANLKGPWKTSKVGKKYAELRPDRPSLDYRHKLNASMTALVERTVPPNVSSTSKTDKKDSSKKGTVLSLCTSCNDDVPMDDFLINALLTYILGEKKG